MKLVSWDVGVYNLAYCILEKNKDELPKIIGWNIVNLVDNEKMKKNRNLLFENIPRKLQEIPELLDVDIVVIENQPSLKNPQMKSIQMILYSYFLILGKTIGNGDKTPSYIDTIDFCSASNKLKVYDGPEIKLPEKKIRKGGLQKISNIEDEPVIETEDENSNDETQKIKKEEVKEKKPRKGSEISYADKKRLSIEHSKYFLEKNNNNQYISFFNEHKKKDDLADSFLQGLYYIKKNKY
jgi:hypothetical protein